MPPHRLLQRSGGATVRRFSVQRSQGLYREKCGAILSLLLCFADNVRRSPELSATSNYNRNESRHVIRPLCRNAVLLQVVSLSLAKRLQDTFEYFFSYSTTENKMKELTSFSLQHLIHLCGYEIFQIKRQSRKYVFAFYKPYHYQVRDYRCLTTSICGAFKRLQIFRHSKMKLMASNYFFLLVILLVHDGPIHMYIVLQLQFPIEMYSNKCFLKIYIEKYPTSHIIICSN